MAEFVTKLALGPLVSAVNEKVSSYLLEQYKVMAGMEEQHAILKRRLPAIVDVITEAEENSADKGGVKAWLEALKTLAYEANDVFDEFKYEALRREAKEKGHYTKLGMDVVSLFPSHNPIVFRYRMGKKLQKIVQAIEFLVAEMNAFGFQRVQQAHADQRRSVIKQSRQTDSFVGDDEKEDIIGRDGAKDEIVNSLLQHANENDLVGLPIFGIGGLGKTTLAQLVYNDPKIQGHFQERRWVCVSDDFDVANLLEKINIKKAPENDDKNVTENAQEKAPKKLMSMRSQQKPDPINQQEVSGRMPNEEVCGQKLQSKNIAKRFLLVLDDVWNRDSDKWATLKTRLPKGGAGSAILTTTRDKQVADIMRTVESHELGKLKKEELLTIFKRRAFGPKEQKPNEQLVKIGENIVERCCGSPLAAKALGSLLSTTRKKKEWTYVLEQSSICNEQTGILPLLKLSYDNLPPHMKQCFAFCAVFPKDYEIDVDKLIQLWIAHDFIQPQKVTGSLETIGEQIFKELTSRSFFQELKQVPFQEEMYIYRYEWHKSNYGFHPRTVCKIHDLMHDVALSVMGKECVTITEELNEVPLPPNATRHLFCSYGMESVLNRCLEKTAQVVQTLLCDSRWSAIPSKQHLSKCSSLRALCLHEGFSIKPKNLQHLRYLDLSNNSDIKALPEDISILYNLQTLNLSGCSNLCQLPKNMKYMCSLRHLHTDGCNKLKCMPPDLGRLTSLQTLTSFVVGASSDCSKIGELQDLNLGGRLELCHLDHVKEADARAANLKAKEDITQVSFVWKNDSNSAADDHQVLAALEPHYGIKVIRVCSYGSTSFPTWMTGSNMLQHLIELHIVDCKMCEKLPHLWQLPALQVVYLKGLEKLQFLCSGDRDNTNSSTFRKLKELLLDGLNSLKGWWKIGGQLIFPMLEKLSIKGCSELTTLPLIPISGESSDSNDNKAHSEFPELKALKLHDLNSFERWGAMEGTEGAQLIFPKLEKLSIKRCLKLEALPDARSAFPVLKELKLHDLERFKRWGATKVGEGEKETFPLLENISIDKCPELTILPEAPKLTILQLKRDELKVSLFKGRPKYMDPLIIRYGGICDSQKHDILKSVAEASVRNTELISCTISFSLSQEQLPTGFWESFKHLEDLVIYGCDGLLHFAEEEFKSLESLRRLTIQYCKKLTVIGCAEVEDPEQAAATGNQFPPRLKSLTVEFCESLTELLNLPPSLRKMSIGSCPKLESIWGKQGRRSESTASASTSAPQPSPPTTHHHLLPSLQCLSIWECHSLVEVLNLPPSLTSMRIWVCDKLQFLSGQLDALESLDIAYCKRLRSLESCLGDLLSLKTLQISSCRNLQSLPDVPRGYLSLQYLEIAYCPGIKALPKRLKSLQHKDISHARSSDPDEGPRLLDPKSWKYVTNEVWRDHVASDMKRVMKKNCCQIQHDEETDD